jgi:hypothetical protein
MTRKHRRRSTIHLNGHPVVVPSPPPGLSAARRRSWEAYWESEAGRAAAQTGDLDTARTLWGLYGEFDKVTRLLHDSPTMTMGSMGQKRVNPLASRHLELTREIRQQEKSLAIGGPLNRQRLPEVEVDPAFLLARMNARVPSLDHPEFGGFIWGDEVLTADNIEREAAARLRDGHPLCGCPIAHHRHQPGDGACPDGPLDTRRLVEVIKERGIDQAELLDRAAERNRENAELLLAEWERMLAEATQELTSVGAGTEAETRLRALISVLEEHLDDAAERGVMYAQASPARKTDLDSARYLGT